MNVTPTQNERRVRRKRNRDAEDRKREEDPEGLRLESRGENDSRALDEAKE